MTELLTDRAGLEDRLRALVTTYREGRLDGRGLEALAECHFRLAVDPSAGPEEAIGHLQHAIRTDGSNPRYSYHLGRLLFLHGELDRAGTWLRRAHELCATSHRVWAHLSLLQRELDSRYERSDRYEASGLQKRSAKLSDAVLDGRDRIPAELIGLDPPVSLAWLESRARRGQRPPRDTRETEPKGAGGSDRIPRKTRRIQNPQRCRWSGVADLRIEEGLEARPDARGRDRMAKTLAQIVESTKWRLGGEAGFHVLAVEWILHGYPLGLLHRLAKELSEGADSPSGRLLERVVELLEIDAGKLASELAIDLQARRIPPLLAAWIHRRRLLWRSMEFPSLGASCRAARDWLRHDADPGKPPEVTEREATEHASAIRKALEELDAARPPILVEDAEPDTSDRDIGDPAKIFGAIERSAKELKDVREQVFRYLKESMEPTSERLAEDAPIVAQLVADRKAFEDLLGRIRGLGDSGQRCLDRVHKALGEMGEQTSLDNLATRKEEVERDLAYTPRLFKKPLERIDGRLRESREGGDSLTPSPALQDFQASVERIRGLDDDVDGARPVQSGTVSEHAVTSTDSTPEVPAEPASPVEKLERLLRDVEDRVSQRFDRALAGFEPYSAAARKSGPIRALRLSVIGRQAEAFYRLGLRRSARSCWLEMLGEDPLRSAALKNIAVCDTFADGSGSATGSWRAYAETLYYTALVSGDPSRASGRRIDLHREFAHAYAPSGLLSEDKDAPAPDPISVASFLNSRGRVKAFIDHKLLELLNTHLAFDSPTLLLGVAREEADDLRSRGRDVMMSLVDEIRGAIPDRVRSAFTDTVRRRLDAAVEECSSARRLTLRRDPDYPEEEKRLLDWLTNAVRLKHRLLTAICGRSNELPPGLLEALRSPAFVRQFERLDLLPLGNSPKLLAVVSGRFGLDDPGLLCELMRSQFRTRIVNAFIAAERPIDVLDLLLDDVVRDDRTPRLPLAAIQTFAMALRKKADGLDQRLLLSTVRGWLERARARIRAEAAGEADLVEEIDRVQRELEGIVVEAALEPVGGIRGNDTDWGKIDERLRALTDEDPGNGYALYLRMVASYDFGAKASQRKDTRGAIRHFQSSRDLGAEALQHLVDEDLRRRVEEQVANINQLLSEVE